MVVFPLTVVVLLTAKLIQATPTGNRDDLQDQEISEIKKMVIVQSELIQSQAEMLREYGKRMASLEKENNDHAQRTEKLQTANEELEYRLRNSQQVEIDYPEEDDNVTSGQWTDKPDDEDVQQADDKPSRIRRVANAPENNLTAVGFYSRLVSPTYLQLGQHQAIEFDNVMTNVGNGYDSRHGHFTAPVDGLYSFTSTVLLRASTNHNMHLTIVKNGVDVGILFSLTEYDKGTRTVVLSLAAGDMVWVRNNENNQPSVHGVGYSTFSGYLITAFSQRS